MGKRGFITIGIGITRRKLGGLQAEIPLRFRMFLNAMSIAS